MKSIKDDFCGYLEIENNKYTYNISNDLVTVLPAQSESQRIYESFNCLMTHNTDAPEYFYGEDDNTKIAILCKGKFVTSPIGISVSAKFRTPIIVKSSGNADGFCNRLTAPWNKFHAITFYGGSINTIYDPVAAIEPMNYPEYFDGIKEIKLRPRNDYSYETYFQIKDKKITLTLSIDSDNKKGTENRESCNLRKLDSYICFSFADEQGFEEIERYYVIARKLVAILTRQNNVFFEKVCLSQKVSENKLFETAMCKIFSPYENYSFKRKDKVIQMLSVFKNIPELVNGIVDGKADTLFELLPEDNRWVNRISIKNIQDLCTALEVAYNLDNDRKRKKDELIKELKSVIKNAIKEFIDAHEEIDVNKETTINSAFKYLDFTLKQKILTLYNENKNLADKIVSKYTLPEINEDSTASFVKLRDVKTHSGRVELDETARLYYPLFAIVYACFLRYVGVSDEQIESILLQVF